MKEKTKIRSAQVSFQPRLVIFRCAPNADVATNHLNKSCGGCALCWYCYILLSETFGRAFDGVSHMLQHHRLHHYWPSWSVRNQLVPGVAQIVTQAIHRQHQSAWLVVLRILRFLSKMQVGWNQLKRRLIHCTFFSEKVLDGLRFFCLFYYIFYSSKVKKPWKTFMVSFCAERST